MYLRAALFILCEKATVDKWILSDGGVSGAFLKIVITSQHRAVYECCSDRIEGNSQRY